MSNRDTGGIRVLIYGAGAVGAFVGGSLARAGHEVTLLARPALRDALAREPLRITGEGGEDDISVPVAAVAGLDELTSPPELVILAVKSYDTAGALPDLRRLVAEGAPVLTLQNGVGNEEELGAALGTGAVRAGAFTISVSTPEPGRVVRHTRGGGLGFAPVAGADRASLAPLLALFAPTGLPLVVARSWRVLKWSKLLLNILANAQSALLDLPPGALFADPRSFAIERRAFLEARAAMHAAGIGLCDLPAYPVRALAAAMALPAPLSRSLLRSRVGRGRGAKMPSLWHDLAGGKGQTEAPWYNGAVTALGARVGVATPINAALTHLLAEATSDPAIRARFHHAPERLLAALDN
ncbi:MAG: 2-dehydropantoate 2-reductase [uncultured Thermomicrobiales bacterium]|uniref:2-dehydropantoate 2-reductase n=1 Tax=uncultured Thermomicrobiales bacterium TaxID=1645740 RepID=A0A6J4UYL2_9BACT|nr:MAG: 2-dehydropantoate 2-reductase [uncultured Thermomicrobiales bacterium]